MDEAQALPGAPPVAPNVAEIKKIRQLLQRMSSMATEASMSGALSAGAPAAVARYNACLARLNVIGAPVGLFAPLDEGTSFDALGVEAALLADFLKEDESENRWHGSTIEFNGPIMGIRDVAQFIRSLPDEMRAGAGVSDLPTLEFNGPIMSGGDEGSAADDVPSEAIPATLSETESRLVEVGAKLQAGAGEPPPGGPRGEKSAVLPGKPSPLGREQALLARRHAALREAETE
jgi:hypothetical protein